MQKVLAVLIAAVLVAPSAVVAQGPGPRRDAPRRMHDRGPGMGPGGGAGMGGMFSPQALLRHRDRLNLTDAQVSQLETLAEESRAAIDKAEADAKPYADQLRELWKADKPDATAIQQQMQALMQTRHAAGLTAAANTAKAKGLLTAEQLGRVEGWVAGRRMAGRQFDGPPGRGRSDYRMGPRMRRFQ